MVDVRRDAASKQGSFPVASKQEGIGFAIMCIEVG